ncbi:hypothetical protein [Peribacillus sp. SI8-4]|uniref:hypothetical protein n=1 Tax=Peribacillus sp. SI8-4 TaxID=3048009 RepID=UPI002556FF84|nr:hypothetical protein [Peribacillus sp. SI8-4]
MLGLLINEKEKMEMVYLLKKEMDEIISDFHDERVDHLIKRAMNEKYNLLYGLLRRMSAEEECHTYMKEKAKLLKRNY